MRPGCPSGARLEGEVALVDAAPLDVEHEAPAGALVVDGEVQRLLQAAGAVVSGGDFSAEGTRQVRLRAVVDAQERVPARATTRGEEDGPLKEGERAVSACGVGGQVWAARWCACVRAWSGEGGEGGTVVASRGTQKV